MRAAALSIGLLACVATCSPNKSELAGCAGRGKPEPASASCQSLLTLMCQGVSVCCKTQPETCPIDAQAASPDGGIEQCLEYSRTLGLDCTSPQFADQRTCSATSEACGKQLIEVTCQDL